MHEVMLHLSYTLWEVNLGDYLTPDNVQGNL